MSVDHYQTLGVHSSAEDFVIRAAYRALAHRYHPDKLGPEERHLVSRMALINGAYEVLSDQGRRREYDKLRSEQLPPHGPSSLDDFFDEPPTGIPLGDADWQKALEYYPDLGKIDTNLARTSWKLAWMFRAVLLESKGFERRQKLATELRERFFTTHFGSNGKVLDFARDLIRLRMRAAAEELSQAASVLGSAVPANRIIDRVVEKFNLKYDQNLETWIVRGSERELYCAQYKAARVAGDYFMTKSWADKVLRGVGAVVKRTWILGHITGVRYGDEDILIRSDDELYAWIDRDFVSVIPDAQLVDDEDS